MGCFHTAYSHQADRNRRSVRRPAVLSDNNDRINEPSHKTRAGFRAKFGEFMILADELVGGENAASLLFGTEATSENELRVLITRDSMVGVSQI